MDRTIGRQNIGRGRRIAMACVLAVALAGCGATTDATLTKAMMEPSKFNLYSCKDIDARARLTRTREQELAKEMDTASKAAGGAIINTIAYRNEYLQVRAELDSLVEAAAAKNCATQSPWTSERSVF